MFLLFLAWSVPIEGPPPIYSIELEESLRTELFTGYTVQQRPNQRVGVALMLTILTVNDLVRYFNLLKLVFVFLPWQHVQFRWAIVVMIVWGLDLYLLCIISAYHH